MNSFEIPKSKLTKFNFYGLNFPLRYKNETKFSSYLGITLSFLSIILLIIIVIKYGYDLLSYSNFTVIQSQKDLNREKIINFTDIPLMIGLCDNLGNPIQFNKKYYQITMYKQSIYPLFENNSFIGIESKMNNIEITTCNDSQKILSAFELFEGFDYEKYLCPKSNQNLYIKGRYGEVKKGFDIIHFYVERCVNSSKNNYSCVNESEINTFFSEDIFLSIYFIKEVANHYNINHPITKDLRTDYFSISLDVRKLYIYNFLISEYLSDNGFIFQNIKKYNFAEIYNLYVDILRNENPYAQLGVIFTCVEHEIQYVRKYNKIQDMCSSLGGILTFIFKIFEYITVYITKKTFISDITNNLVNVKSNNIRKIHKLSVKDLDSNNKNNLNVNKLNVSSKNQFLHKNQDDILWKKEIKKLNDINNNFIEKNKISFYYNNSLEKKRNHKFLLFDYFLPISIIKKRIKYSILFNIYDTYNFFMSIENIIPVIERFPHLLKFMIENFNFKYDNEFFKYYYFICHQQ